MRKLLAILTFLMPLLLFDMLKLYGIDKKIIALNPHMLVVTVPLCLLVIVVWVCWSFGIWYLLLSKKEEKEEKEEKVWK